MKPRRCRLRIAIVALTQVTNQFSRHSTRIENFEQRGLAQGSAVLDAFAESNTPVGGAIESARLHSVELLPLLAAYGVSGGPVSDTTLEALIEAVLSELHQSGSLDGLWLELSGTMRSESQVNGDAYVASRLREALADNIPIGLIIGRQANLSANLLSQSTFTTDAGPFPYVRSRSAGARSLETLINVIRSGSHPIQTFSRLPVRVPLMFQSDAYPPMKHLTNVTNSLRQLPGMVSIALATGFPYAGTADVGMGVAVSSTEWDVAKRVTDSLMKEVEAFTKKLVHDGLSVEQAVHQAMSSSSKRTILADLGDDPLAGGPGDGTALLWGLLDLGAHDALLAGIVDAEAIHASISAGLGSRVHLEIGAHSDHLHGYPIEIDAEVIRVGGGRIKLYGPVDAGLDWDIGRAIVLRARGRHDGHVDIILTEQQAPVFDQSLYDALELTLTDHRIVAVKSSTELSGLSGLIADERLDVITPGITVPVFDYLDFHHQPTAVIWRSDQSHQTGR